MKYRDLALIASERVYDVQSDPTHKAVKDIVSHYGFDTYKLINTLYSEALVADSASLLMIAVRGTDEWEEWFNNFFVGPRHNLYDLVADKSIHVHAGFESRTYRLLEKLNDTFAQESLISKATTKKRVLLTGHSVGGAVAALIAFWTTAKYRLPTTLYGFGTPRVGDETLYNELDRLCGTAVFYEHLMDVVPYFPPHYLNNPLAELVGGLRNPFDVVGNHQISTYREAMIKETVPGVEQAYSSQT